MSKNIFALHRQLDHVSLGTDGEESYVKVDEFVDIGSHSCLIM